MNNTGQLTVATVVGIMMGLVLMDLSKEVEAPHVCPQIAPEPDTLTIEEKIEIGFKDLYERSERIDKSFEELENKH